MPRALFIRAHHLLVIQGMEAWCTSCAWKNRVRCLVHRANGPHPTSELDPRHPTSLRLPCGSLWEMLPKMESMLLRSISCKLKMSCICLKQMNDEQVRICWSPCRNLRPGKQTLNQDHLPLEHLARIDCLMTEDRCIHWEWILRGVLNQGTLCTTVKVRCVHSPRSFRIVHCSLEVGQLIFAWNYATHLRLSRVWPGHGSSDLLCLVHQECWQCQTLR